MAGVNNSLCTIDVDLLEHIMTNIGVDSNRRGCVDDNVGLELLEQREKPLGVGDVAFSVLGIGIAIALAS